MKFLVTGFGGFIGQVCQRILIEQGHRLLPIVRRAEKQQETIVWDFKSPLTEIPPVDGVIHLAASVHFKEALDPQLYAVNVLGTYHLARLAQKMGAFFVFASTIGVHGQSARIGPQTEIAPSSHYAMSKLLAEHLLEEVTKNSVILRIGGVYGLHGPSHLSLNTAITQAYEDRKVPVLKGNGAGRRNYLSVTDAARWICTVAQNPTDYAGKILYLASPEHLTIRQYLEEISRVLTDGRPFIEEPGKDTSDVLIEPSPVPFALSNLSDYLKGLAQKRPLVGQRV